MVRNRQSKAQSSSRWHETKREARRPGADVREAVKQPSPPSRPGSYPVDKVEEASMESFPASDAPGYGTGHV